MLDAFNNLLYPKLCWHNKPRPTSICNYLNDCSPSCQFYTEINILHVQIQVSHGECMSRITCVLGLLFANTTTIKIVIKCMQWLLDNFYHAWIQVNKLVIIKIHETLQHRNKHLILNTGIYVSLQVIKLWSQTHRL